MKAVGSITYILDLVRLMLDIAIITFVLYKAYDFIAKTNGMQLIKAAGIIASVCAVAFILQLQTLKWIISQIGIGALIAIAIVFQPEMRKLFLRLGQSKFFELGVRSESTYINTVLIAAEILSKQRRGMLVVFLRHTKHDDIMKNGVMINADLSSALLVTIFQFDTQLHDGACFVQGSKLIAAGCVLPVSEQQDIKKTFGTRHRAALGISEVSDCVVLVVSEETGAISLAYDAMLHYDLTTAELTKILESQLEISNDKDAKKDVKNVEVTANESTPQS